MLLVVLFEIPRGSAQLVLFSPRRDPLIIGESGSSSGLGVGARPKLRKMGSIAIMTMNEDGARLASVFGYLEGSAGDGRTVSENEHQWERYAIVPRAFRDVAHVDSSIRLLGVISSFPVLVAPTAGQFLIEGVAETATARGARAAGVPFIRSYQAQSTIEDVAAEQPDWMQQVYLPRDRERVLPHLREAVDHGAAAIIVTVDQISTGFVHDFRKLVSFEGLNAPSDPLASAVTLSDLNWLVEAVPIPVIAKGILHPDDARAAVDVGAAGIVVSNHGGRQIAGSITPAEVLADVASAIAGRALVLADSGIRTEGDIFRAIALGASGVLIGRPIVRALWDGGSSAVENYLSELHSAFDALLALAGTPSVAQITRDAVRRRV